MNRITITALLTLALSWPFYIWVAWAASNNRMPTGPWRLVIGLYIPSVITFVVLVHKALYRRELARAIKGDTGVPTMPRVVWISSLDHLKRFRNLPWYATWLGLVPAGFPKVKTGFISSPLVYFAQGNLSLTHERLICDAFTPADALGKSYEDLASGLRLSFSRDQVCSVRRFDMQQVLPNALPLPFISIQTTDGELRDFLLCAGSDDVSAIGSETEGLWYALSQFTAQQSNEGGTRPVRA